MMETRAEVRSRIMRSVKREHTAPELKLRRVLHSLGLRFRLHRKDLPGSPDIVLSKHRTIIFVHGCFWHRHPNCRLASIPKTRTEFWASKFEANINRDIKNSQMLSELGWRVLIYWECELKDSTKLTTKIMEDFRIHY